MFRNKLTFFSNSENRKLIMDSILFAILIIIFSFFLYDGTEELGYNWQWFRIPEFIYTYNDGRLSAGLLLQGLLVTLKISAISFVLTFTIGLGSAILRLSNSFVGNALSRIYLEAIRNTPLLIQLFFIYFVIAPILNISGFWAAVIALSLFEGAYASEIFRAGITSIDKGQWEASYSLGGNTKFAYFNVILPQAIPRIALPLRDRQYLWSKTLHWSAL